MSPVGNVTPSELLAIDKIRKQLEASIAQTNIAAALSAERMRSLTLALAAAYSTDPASPPIVPPTAPPPSGGYGFDGDEAALTEWIFAAVQGAGRPSSVGAFAADGTMQDFRFRPPTPGAPSDRGIASGATAGIGPITIENVTVRGYLGNPSIEHGLYFGLEAGQQTTAPLIVRDSVIDTYGKWGARTDRVGGLIVKNVLFVDIPAQAIQQVQRDFHKGQQDADDPATFDADMPPIVLEHVKAMNVGANSGNASYAFSFFAPEVWSLGRAMRRASQGIRIRDLHVDNSMQAVCKGGLLVEGKQSVDIEDGSFIFGGPTDRPLALIQGNPGPVSVQGLHFSAEGGQDVVKVELDAGQSFTWRGNTGTTRLLVNGVDVGPVSKDQSA